MNHIVYCVENIINRDMYIGETGKKLNKRKYEHERDALKGSNTHFHCALRLYGFENFIWRIIDEAPTKKQRKYLEKLWIKELDTRKNGYNLTDGGDGCLNYKFTDKQREKQRQSRIGKNLSIETKNKISESLKGENNPNFGKHRSEETKIKSSLSNKGKQAKEKNPWWKKFGVLNPKSKCVIQSDLEGNDIKEWGSAREIHRELGYSQGSISSVCRGEYKQSKGFLWRFKE